MDTLRGSFGALDAADLGPGIDAMDADLDDSVDHAPPPVIGTDERRMQVRAYNFWASLLDERNFPAIEDLDPDNLPDFGPHSVLLDFTTGIDDPSINFIGDKLMGECYTANDTIPQRLSDVPPRSLLSRITDHYMQIIANQAPIGFEAEFVNQQGVTILYRGILLPFSSDDESIDFIYGVINWKEMAAATDVDELVLEMDQAMEVDAPVLPRAPSPEEITDWADGPASAVDGESPLPAPSFGFSRGDLADEPLELSYAETVPEVAVEIEIGAAIEVDEADMALADWLAVAREMAQAAKSSEERTRTSLYEAVSRAYDFAVAAMEAPEEFAELLADAGLTVQDRAPMTPVVKLVFGAEYDKTRLTEYAAVLSWAKRTGVERGKLGEFLKQADGGLKAIIAAEREFRREQEGKAPAPKPKGPKKAIARKLRAIEPREFAAIAPAGEEFALVMIRRTDEGEVVVLGEVPDNASLIEKAARELLD
ncbi:hypothetical protein [Aurantiacibacter gilvus]|uniref:PAS domain-containing protein n=1 Tax=Aurantiacibacter gilvus TaxID=3139141 RepID=A0ABU9IHL0_9SPHN